MSFILSEHRDVDVVAAFAGYRAYLAQHASRFPPRAYELATSDWYFNPQHHESPHDAWLETATIGETATEEGHERRLTTLRLLGAYHDGHVELQYPHVYSYTLIKVEGESGHRDWRYDEFRLADGDGVIHEIEWAGPRHTGRWVIHASDVIHRWIPQQ